MKPTTASTRDIFLEAIELSAAARNAFLDRVCADDPLLRRRVEELLAQHETIADFLDAPAAQPTLRDGSAKPGDRIGRYRLLQEIGEGGAGVVFMAEQTEPVRRRVALKALKSGMDTRQVVARFEAERQALAMMDHPNIAAVFDAGATESGRPYFVMELVRGTPITTYCDQHNLAVKARLKLFMQVCHAIQHAHQKGIIHRDIKPSNILVTESEGGAVPKVIDFGIAKAIEQPLTDKTLFTEFRSLIGTPAYMSPEQVDMAGADVDTRSDVYSLGVLLYEILTGQTPFAGKSLMQSGVEEFRRAVREDEPDRPSTRLTHLPEAQRTTTATQRGLDNRSLERALRGELDWIVMKCLEKDRGRRYATVNGLAAEVERFLEGEPVLARAPTTAYRAQKFLRRHQIAVGAAAIVVVALMSASIISIRQAATARKAGSLANESKLRAEAESARAQQNEARALLNEYVADMTLAHQALSAGNFGRAHSLLAKHKPAPGKPDLRGFEWGYLTGLTRGDPHEVLVESGDSVRSVAFSKNGKFIAIGAREKATILDTASRSVLSVSTGAVFSVAFAPDNSRLYIADHSSIRAVDLRDYSEANIASGVGAPIGISNDGRHVAAVNREGVRLFQTNPWGMKRVLSRAFGPLAFSPDGETLATSSKNGLLLWPVNGRDEPVEIPTTVSFGFFHQFARTLVISPDGSRLFAPQDKSMIALDTKSGAQISMIPADGKPIHTSQIVATALSPDEKILATASWDHSIQLWDARNYSHIGSLRGHLNEVWSIAFSPDGKSILSGAKDGGVFLWPLNAQEANNFIPGDWQPLAFSSNEKSLAAANRRNGGVSLIDLETGRVEEILEGSQQSARGGFFGARVSINADLNVVARNAFDRIEIIERNSGRKTTVESDGDHFIGLALAPDGTAMIGTTRNSAAIHFDLRSNIKVSLPVRADRALFASDSKRVVLLQREGPATIWNFSTRSAERSFTPETAPGFASALSPDNRILAAGAQPDLSNTIELIDILAGKTITTLSGHKQGIGSVAFSADGKTLASVGSDNTLKLWNIPTQQEILTLPVQANSALFSPRGSYLVFAVRASHSEGLQIFRSSSAAFR